MSTTVGNLFPLSLPSQNYSTLGDEPTLTCSDDTVADYAHLKKVRTHHYETFPLDPSVSELPMVKSSSTGTPARTLAVLGQRNSLSKSSSLPNPDNLAFHDLPDPFPELTHDRLAPVLAQMYSSDTSSSLPVSPEKEVKSILRVDSSSPTPSCNHRMSGSGTLEAESCIHQKKMTIDVYVSECKYHSVEIDATTTVASVCDRLAVLSCSKRDPFWTIVEHIDKLNLERSLEDHELMYPIFKSWDSTNNRFYYRKDFNRYELYSNPNHCFPEHMIDVELPKEDMSGFMTRHERYRNLLLQNLLANQSMPDVQGILHVRDGKKAWKKHFCVLRSSGLYYVTKGTTKDPKNMVLLSDLCNNNIYMALNAKKVFSAPTQFCFCLAPADDASNKRRLKQFCTEDEQTRLCWITGLRFFKFGYQLQENFRISVRWNSEPKKLENSDGRIVQPLRSSISSYQTTPRSSMVLSPNEPLCTNLETSSMKNCEEFEWFHDTIGRDEAVSLICMRGLSNGTFLVRHSQTLPGVHVLSFAHNNTVKHCTIHKVQVDGWCYYSLDGGSTKFMDLAQLVDFYRVNAGRLPTRLTHPIARFC